MLERLFLLCCFFPFVSPYPINSDVQPLAGLFALLVIVKNGFILKIKLPKRYIVILFFTCGLLAYNNPFSSNFDADIGKMFSLIFGALILTAFYYSHHKMDKKFINSVVCIYFVFTILLLLFTAPMIEVQNLLIRNTNSSDFSYRGVATLATEPGLFGGLLVFFLLITDFLRNELRLTKKNQYTLYFMIFFMLLWTKSGTGYLYFLFYLMFKFYMSNIRLHFKVTSFVVLSGTIIATLSQISNLDPSTFGRGAHILLQLSDPASLMNSDASILTRIIDSSMAFVSITEYPLGVGNGSVVDTSYNLMINTPYIKSFYESNNKIFGLNSSFTYLTIAYGLFSWFLLFLIYFCYSKSDISSKFFSFLFLAVSFSSAFPAIWVLLALNFGVKLTRSKPVLTNYELIKKQNESIYCVFQ